MAYFVNILILLATVSSFPNTESKKCPMSFYRFEENCYWFATQDIQMSWIHALVFCEYMNSHLVVINNERENKIIEGFLRRHFTVFEGLDFWIGASKMRDASTWVWESVLSPDALNYTNWYNNETSTGRGFNCAFNMYSGEFYWSNYRCSRHKAFICELD